MLAFVQRLDRLNDEVRLVDRYEASVLNKLTERGPAWTILALLALNRRAIVLTLTGLTTASGFAAKALGWW